jgi:hypothetical protein
MTRRGSAALDLGLVQDAWDRLPDLANLATILSMLSR